MKLRAKANLLFFTASCLMIWSTGTLQASTVKGSIYENSPGAADATPANVPSTSPDVTFTTSTPIDFTSGFLYTIGEFLDSGAGSVILSGSSQLGNTLDNTLFNFTGTVSVTNGEVFTAGHDDGLTLVIGGVTAINAPGPTAFANTSETYIGPSGNLPFQLVYGECCGAPAGLSISLPLTSSSPEPGSALLFGIGILALGIGAKRKFLR